MPIARKALTLVAALTLGGSVAAVQPAAAAVRPAAVAASPGALPVRAGTDYLALGDSVPFGYREPTSIPTPDYRQPDTFVGYPEDVAAALSFNVANAACPGETTASFIDVAAPSNGCENGYRLAYPLHVQYSGSQLDFAIGYLTAHPQTSLVTLMIGANDGFLCQRTTADHCASELPAVLKSVAHNVRVIVSALRQDAGYAGQIVVVGYYSLDYRDATQTRLTRQLNLAVHTAAAPFRVRFANGFLAFKLAAASAGGDPCAAGLLTVLTTGGCGIHPSAAGQAVLAGAVEHAIRTAG